jgi:hypothetical protein
MQRVIAIQLVGKYLVEIQFSDGLRKTVDLEPFIGKGVSTRLLDEGYFRLVEIESGGGIAWPNGFDFCPNFLYSDVPSIEPALPQAS